METVKWIRLSTGLFDNRKIKAIEQLPDGDTIIVVWLKLLILAGEINDSGCVYFTKDIPFTESLLSTQFQRPLPVIQLALSTFQHFGMIEIVDDMIYVTNWERYQNAEGLEKIREQNRIRQQRFRENKREAIAGTNPRCVYCGKEGIAPTIDHVIPRSKGGTDNDDNKVTCCLDCNMEKTNNPLITFLNGRIALKRPVDIDGILNNPKLNRYVNFDAESGFFVSASRQVTLRNATDKNREEKKREEKRRTIETAIAELAVSDELKDALQEFNKMRKLIKRPLTERALSNLLNKLQRLSTDERYQIASLNESILHGWQSVFPLDRKEIPSDNDPEIDRIFGGNG